MSGKYHSGTRSAVEKIPAAMKIVEESIGILQTGFISDPKSGAATLTSIGGFTSASVGYMNRCAQLKSSFAYWVGEGSESGGGRLTAALAEEAAIFCKNIIRSEIIRDKWMGASGGPSVKFQPLTEKYDEWKRSVAPTKGMFSMSGAMADAFGARSRGGKAVLGMSASAKVRPIVVYGDGHQRLPKSVYVIDYANTIEYGLNGQPERPIQQAAVLAWIYTANESWGDMFRAHLSSVFWLTPETSGSTVSSDTENFNAGVADTKRSYSEAQEAKQELLIAVSGMVHTKKKAGESLKLIKEQLYEYLGDKHTDKEIKRVYARMVSGQIVHEV